MLASTSVCVQDAYGQKFHPCSTASIWRFCLLESPLGLRKSLDSQLRLLLLAPLPGVLRGRLTEQLPALAGLGWHYARKASCWFGLCLSLRWNRLNGSHRLWEANSCYWIVGEGGCLPWRGETSRSALAQVSYSHWQLILQLLRGVQWRLSQNRTLQSKLLWWCAGSRWT